MSELNPNNTSQFIIELVRDGTVRNFRTVQTEGERKIAREIPLVPKLQLGNKVGEAPASRDGKLELPVPHSQAGAWERATSKRANIYEEGELDGQATCNNFLQVQTADAKDST